MEDKKALLAKLALNDAESKAPSRRRLILISAAGVSALAVLSVAVFFSPWTKASPANAEAAETESAQARVSPLAPTGEETLNAAGYVTARRMATVSAEITGRIREVLVEEGMYVEAGAVVARLDDELARLDLGLAEAEATVAQAGVDSARAHLAEVKRVLLRTHELQAENFSSQAALTKAEADVLVETAGLARARAELDIALLRIARLRETLEDYVIRAPFAGVVVQKNAQAGEIIAPGSAGGGFTRTGICTLVDMDSLEIEVDVNERYIGRVAAGQRAEARLHAYPDWIIPARVVAIVPTADREKATVKVRVGLEQSDARILPDMGADVAFLNNESKIVELQQ